MNVKSIISVIGHIGSGKSYASNLIQNEFGFPIASFGGYLNDYCKTKNLPLNRITLQDIGESFVEANPKQFLIDVISHFIGSSESIILDGVRHKSILVSVDQLTKNSLTVFIDADLETRYIRYYNRDKNSDGFKTFDEFKMSDNHPVELEIESLKSSCNIVIDSTKDYSNELITFLSANLNSQF